MRQSRRSHLPLIFGFLGATSICLATAIFLRAPAPVHVPGLKGAVYEPIEWSGSPDFKVRRHQKTDYI